jgi:hypothetical protein
MKKALIIVLVLALINITYESKETEFSATSLQGISDIVEIAKDIFGDLWTWIKDSFKQVFYTTWMNGGEEKAKEYCEQKFSKGFLCDIGVEIGRVAAKRMNPDKKN